MQKSAERESQFPICDRLCVTAAELLAFTADAFDEDIMESMKVGMNAHLTKPIDSIALFIRIGRLCN